MSEFVSCSSVAKTKTSGRADLTQALTGLLLVIFSLFHAILVGSVIISPSIMDGIAWLLGAIYIEQITGPIILLVVVVHFIFAARKMPFRLGECQVISQHAKQMKHCDTYLWILQVITAIIVLVFVSVHIYTIMVNLPITAESSAMRMQSGWTPFYLILLVSVAFHSEIGLYRLGVKFGCIKAVSREVWVKRTWIHIGIYLALGVLIILRLNFLAV